MDNFQRKHLEERMTKAVQLKKVERFSEYGNRDVASMPIAIRKHFFAAKRHDKVVARWRKQAQSAVDRQHRRVANAAYKVREVILFGDAEKALKAVQSFERLEIK